MQKRMRDDSCSEMMFSWFSKLLIFFPYIYNIYIHPLRDRIWSLFFREETHTRNGVNHFSAKKTRDQHVQEGSKRMERPCLRISFSSVRWWIFVKPPDVYEAFPSEFRQATRLSRFEYVFGLGDHHTRFFSSQLILFWSIWSIFWSILYKSGSLYIYIYKTQT